MSEKKFSKKHEWVSLEGDIATVGITKHATELLGDIVFAEVPETGKPVEKEGQAAVVESTKAASDVYSPISGEISEGNKAIVDDPSSINTDPEGASWFFKLKIKDKGEFDSLMSKEEYEKFCKDNPN
jgi:glycine cleavage system H protein